ncbi:MAG: hypothetical protein COU32_04325 [Candidatus Magasanikbacteria bacterium CG10_big_fil_rev_8_21_14_0_10_42_10]|uniref:FAD-binding FR-type domain-containing protein n=2 Tax=Candidatus Magasanikiibacteriota TaxID=1752731 RepID=A0A2H0TV30_9BACT|nr:MAG: hypothetical protein COU32_04325 [Candidatus Magasanikbacteria bacterium CG10_big_fil_rev_8_21_14_0_10_42_10]PIZ92443.1 MAG: hypothetical protein COX82_04805 [Candidatus Magasanikbacteria bacterium CG_4_10_14_0_2_um_filter_41_10]
MSTPMQTHTIHLLAKKEVAKNVFELRFSKPESFDFTPGQFVQFLIPSEEKKTPRSYSLSSLPSDAYLEFCIKFLDGGLASEHFRTMNIGTDIECRGPLGRFVVDENNDDHYFVATGVGLAPILGMIRSLIEEKKDDHPIRLLFGVREEDDLFWIDRLETLKQKHSLFDYTVTLSQPQPTGGWQGLKGRVTEHLLQHLGKQRFYLCGNAAMVKDVRTLLIEHGVDTTDIHFEIF